MKGSFQIELFFNTMGLSVKFKIAIYIFYSKTFTKSKSLKACFKAQGAYLAIGLFNYDNKRIILVKIKIQLKENAFAIGWIVLYTKFKSNVLA